MRIHGLHPLFANASPSTPRAPLARRLCRTLSSAAVAALLITACGPGTAEERTVDDPADPGARITAPADERTPTRAGALTVGIQSTDDGGEALCSGDLAADTFRYGLCVCGDLSEAGSLRTSSFTGAPGDDDGFGGGVGVNGDFATAGSVNIGGTLSVGGDARVVGDIDVAGELRVGQRLRGAGAGNVGLDAYVQGEVDVVGNFDVGGTLHVTESPGFSGLFLDADDISVEEFTIDDPCGCDLAEDIDAFIAQAADDNDNEAHGLGPDVTVIGAEDLVLEPGRYYFERIETAGALRLTVTGPTAIYIDGGVALAGALDIDLDGPDASLDLFIGDDLQAAGHLEIGSLDDPDRVRVYLASAADLDIAGHLDFATALYAPQARLRVAGDAEIVGSVVVGEVENAGRLVVRYDADLQGSDDACLPEPAEPDDQPEPQQPEPQQPEPQQPEPQQPEPGDEPEPDTQPEPEPQPDDEPAPEEGCSDFMDCPDPQVCVEGTCVFIDG